jgi:hypothetical protein
MELINLKEEELYKLLKETECTVLMDQVKQEISYRLECYL